MKTINTSPDFSYNGAGSQDGNKTFSSNAKRGYKLLHMAIKISKPVMAIMAIVICCSAFVAAQMFLKSGHTVISLNEPITQISLGDEMFEGIYPGDTVNQNWSLQNDGNVPVTILAMWVPDNGTLPATDYVTNLPKNWTVPAKSISNMTVYWNISAGAAIENLSGDIILDRI